MKKLYITLKATTLIFLITVIASCKSTPLNQKRFFSININKANNQELYKNLKTKEDLIIEFKKEKQDKKIFLVKTKNERDIELSFQEHDFFSVSLPTSSKNIFILYDKPKSYDVFFVGYVNDISLTIKSILMQAGGLDENGSIILISNHEIKSDGFDNFLQANREWFSGGIVAQRSYQEDFDFLRKLDNAATIENKKIKIFAYGFGAARLRNILDIVNFSAAKSRNGFQFRNIESLILYDPAGNIATFEFISRNLGIKNTELVNNIGDFKSSFFGANGSAIDAIVSIPKIYQIFTKNATKLNYNCKVESHYCNFNKFEPKSPKQ
jgi:hypothetical protein